MPDSNVPAAPAIFTEILAVLACPVCHGAFTREVGTVVCTQCQRCYPIQDGIPVLIAERAVLSEQKA
jgi:uncharacterized protein YbaR (Trm112 family)